MPRIARIVATGCPHHITQRGNYRQDIFVDDFDRKKYLALIEQESKRYGLKILVYCLMPNHVHFIAIPEKYDSMANVFKYAHMKYSQYYNKKSAARGHLFQGRFFSSVMDEDYLVACASYIERNPVRANLVDMPYDWEWSSVKVHCGISNNDKLEVRKFFDYTEYSQKDWKRFIEETVTPEKIKKIQDQTIRGRPLGSDKFIEELERNLNRPLFLRPRGRPRKDKK